MNVETVDMNGTQEKKLNQPCAQNAKTPDGIEKYMANRRMLSKTISNSKKFYDVLGKANTLGEFTQVLYLVGLPHTDDFGQVSAKDFDWKFTYLPTSQRNIEDFNEAIRIMAIVGLIEISDCGEAARYTNFFKFQTLQAGKNNKNDYAKAKYSNSKKILENLSGSFPKDKLIESNISKDNLIKEKTLAPSDKKTSLQADAPIMKIPLKNKGEEFLIYEADIAQWAETFPNVNIIQELREIRQWNIDNPGKRKSQTGIRRHISGWLIDEQDKGKHNPKPGQSKNPHGDNRGTWETACADDVENIVAEAREKFGKQDGG